MRGRGACLLIGMKAGQAKAEAAVAQQQEAEAQKQAAFEAGQKSATQAAPAAPAPAAPAAPAAAPAAPSGNDLTAQLKNLADLKAAGHLTDEEYAAAKKKLLGA